MSTKQWRIVWTEEGEERAQVFDDLTEATAHHHEVFKVDPGAELQERIVMAWVSVATIQARDERWMKRD